MIRSKLSDLRLDCLTVRYNGTDVVSDVSLNLTAGPLVGIIGPNGAGKTTLMRAIAGLVRIESGEVLSLIHISEPTRPY